MKPGRRLSVKPRAAKRAVGEWQQWRRGIGGRCAFYDPHQAIGVVVGERLEQHGIDDAEHRGGGADAKASVITTAAVKPGLRARPRIAYETSLVRSARNQLRMLFS